MSHFEHVEHVFRHEYGQLVASLLRRVGVIHLQEVEDAVQDAMMKAIYYWNQKTVPDNLSAWLYTVAYRQLISELRDSQNRQKLLQAHFSLEESASEQPVEVPLVGEMNDSLLRMLFVACNDAIPFESQLVFTLKCLCGFSVREISLRLFITEANVYKRFTRARKVLQSKSVEPDTLTNAQMSTRLDMVHNVLYLLFTEGYLSSQTDSAIRQDLCEEAIRLAKLLSNSTVGNVPTTYALLAMMYFHLSRINARQDDSGSLLLLEHQDRNKWNKSLIIKGMQFLNKSAEGETLSRYHLEANIAAEHCLAPCFEQTKWDKIVHSYELLELIAPTVLHRLNWALALAEWQGPQIGLAILTTKDIPDWLERSYHWHAVIADLQFRCGEIKKARVNAQLALSSAPTPSLRKLLSKRMQKYDFNLKTQ